MVWATSQVSMFVRAKNYNGLAATNTVLVRFSRELQWFERHLGVSGSVRKSVKTASGLSAAKSALKWSFRNRKSSLICSLTEAENFGSSDRWDSGPFRNSVTSVQACRRQKMLWNNHPEEGNHYWFGAGLNQRISAPQTSQILDLLNFAHHDPDQVKVLFGHDISVHIKPHIRASRPWPNNSYIWSRFKCSYQTTHSLITTLTK